MESIEIITEITNIFRKQNDPLWIGVGRALSEKGININKVIVADCFTEDSQQYYVAIITYDKHVFEFYYDFLYKKESEGMIIEWNDFTDDPKKAYRHKQVAIALENFDIIQECEK